MRIKAFELMEIDERYKMHLQAWLNHQVTAMKEQGKKQVPVFEKFTDFYDYEKELKEVEIRKPRVLTDKQKRMARHVALINSL